MSPSDNDRVKSLEKGLNLLILLSREKNGVSLDELTKSSGLNKTTCFRLLKTLHLFGFVEQEPDSKYYRLGPRNISLGAAARNTISLRELALPYMRKLKDLTQETINISVLDGTEIVFVERLEAGHIVSTQHRIGDRLPAHCTCMGKAILSHLRESRLTPILDRILFEQKTPQTISNRGEFLQELETIRREGLSYNLEELEKGLCAVAAPILNHSGEAVAALNVAFPLMRYDLKEALARFGPEVKKAAREISGLLGFFGEKPDWRDEKIS